MAIFLEPLDVWVFRDGHPFSAGDDHHARCVFPPSPFTVQGALRSKVLTERCGNLDKYAGRQDASSCPVCGPAPVCPVRDEVGTPGEAGPFRLRWVLPARTVNGVLSTYFPLPGHAVRTKEVRKWCLLRPYEGAGFTVLPGGLRPLGVMATEPVEHPGGWVEASVLERLLRGEVPQELQTVSMRGDDGILAEEPRVGIGLDRGRGTVKSGRFFIVEALRLQKGWGLAVSFDGLPSLPRNGFLDIGGEGRAARYQTVQEVQWWPAPAGEIGKERRFLLYFIAPVLFGGGSSRCGWKPGFLDDDLIGSIPGSGTRVRLVAAAIGSPLRISGWELGVGSRGGRPRPMRPAVPAGSVYFFEIVDGPVEPVIALQGQTVTDWGSEFGFGLALVGRWLRWRD